MPSKKKTGTYEISDATFNSQRGCTNNCSYGYCSQMVAKKFPGLMPSHGCWARPEYRSKEWIVKHLKTKKYQELTADQVIMYASMHDHTIDNIEFNSWVVEQILHLTKAKILIVTKAQNCLSQLCGYLDSNAFLKTNQSRVSFMFTFGYWENTDYFHKLWEPESPTIETRWNVVVWIHRNLPQYKINFLIEPLFETEMLNINEMIAQFECLDPESIWIGALNYHDRESPNLPFKEIYDTHKTKSWIHFKDSFYTQAKKQGVILP